MKTIETNKTYSNKYLELAQAVEKAKVQRSSGISYIIDLPDTNITILFIEENTIVTIAKDGVQEPLRYYLDFGFTVFNKLDWNLDNPGNETKTWLPMSIKSLQHNETIVGYDRNTAINDINKLKSLAVPSEMWKSIENQIMNVDFASQEDSMGLFRKTIKSILVDYKDSIDEDTYIKIMGIGEVYSYEVSLVVEALRKLHHVLDKNNLLNNSN